MMTSNMKTETNAERNRKKESITTLFALDIVIYNLIGLYSVASALTGKLYRQSVWEVAFLVIGMTPILHMMTCEYLALHQHWAKDRDYAISLFALVFDSILCLIKGVRIWSQRMELRDMLRSLKISWSESLNCDENVRDEIVKSMEKTNFLCKCFVMILTMAGISYTARPCFLTIRHYVYAKHRNISFDLTQTIYPLAKPNETMTSYIICIITEQCSMFCFILYWISSDSMFAKLCTFATLQFRVLCYDLEHIVIKKNKANDEDELINQLAIIAKRHHNLYVFCHRINGIYNPIIFSTMLFTSANMCICAFQVDRELFRSNYIEVVKHFGHAIIIIVQIAIYCNCAEKLTQQSRLVARAAYNCQWMDQSQKFKIMLLIILSRAQDSIGIAPYGFFSLNFRQITIILKTSASYFTLLKAVA